MGSGEAYVEMGMKWESFRENHEKLKRLALARGHQRIPSYRVYDGTKRVPYDAGGE